MWSYLQLQKTVFNGFIFVIVHVPEFILVHVYWLLVVFVCVLLINQAIIVLQPCILTTFFYMKLLTLSH